MSPPEVPVGRLRRLAALLLATALLGMLGVARWLRPDPSGRGTHVQLGLSPCSYLSRTGRPCPSCGMTTAMAWMARGRPDLAWRANPASLILAPASLVLVPWLLAVSTTGRSRGVRRLEGLVIVVVVATVAFGLAAWSVRSFLGRF